MNAIVDSVGFPVDFISTGQNEIVVPAVLGSWHRLMRIVLTFSYEGSDPTELHEVKFLTGDTYAGGGLLMGHGGSITLTLDQRRWFEANVNDPIKMNIGGNGRCSGFLTVYTVEEGDPE